MRTYFAKQVLQLKNVALHASISWCCTRSSIPAIKKEHAARLENPHDAMARWRILTTLRPWMRIPKYKARAEYNNSDEEIHSAMAMDETSQVHAPEG